MTTLARGVDNLELGSGIVYDATVLRGAFGWLRAATRFPLWSSMARTIQVSRRSKPEC